MSNTLEQECLQIPQLSNYEIIGFLGRGNWKSVMHAKSQIDGSEWALKFFSPTDLAKSLGRERGWDAKFVQNKEAMNGRMPLNSRIAHGSLEKADDGTIFYRETYIDRFLNEYLTEKQLPIEEIIHIAKEMSEALVAYHTEAEGHGNVHGDFKPANIGYTKKGRVILTDNGTSTMGLENVVREVPVDLNKFEDMEFIYTRPPEWFIEVSKPKKEFDVWSYGSLLYKLFTGRYFLQDEIESFKDNPAQFMKYLSEQKSVWQDTLERKLKDKSVPLAFKEFFMNCLASPEERYKDAVEMQTGLIKAVSKYESSKPMARLKKYSMVAGVIGMLGIVSAVGIKQVQKVDELFGKLDTQTRRTGYVEKTRVLRAFDLGHQYSSAWEDSVSLGSLRGYLQALNDDGITDKRYAYAAFLNPELTYQAIQTTGTTNFSDFSYYLIENDWELYNALTKIIQPSADNLSRMMSVERYNQAIETWNDLKTNYNNQQRDQTNKNNKASNVSVSML
jgi:serine/threonine protein kinase